MRLIGIILVVLGAMIIAAPILRKMWHEESLEMASDDSAFAIPPVYGGIAVVTGLLVIANTGRRE